MSVLVINPYVSPEYINKTFKKYNISTIALYTKEANCIQEYCRPKLDWFDTQIFTSSEDIDKIVVLLTNYNIDYVINGFEDSLEISDKLAAILSKRYANNPSTSAYRCNKQEMHYILAKNNINCIKQYVFNIMHNNITDLNKYTIRYPCFIKPLYGAGSMYAQNINSQADMCNYIASLNLQEIKQRMLRSNLKNDIYDFLICDFIDGDEFMIDTFSVNGEHYISSIQHNVKKEINGLLFCRYTDCVENIKIKNIITNYVKTSLTALGFNNGFAHTEVFVNAKQCPVLIEVNPRVSGIKGIVNYMANLNGEYSQVELLLQHIFNITIKKPKKIIRYSRLLYIFNLSLNPLPNLKNKLAKFEIVLEVVYLKEAGYIRDNMPENLCDVLAFVICGADNKGKLDLETEQILKLDEYGWN